MQGGNFQAKLNNAQSFLSINISHFRITNFALHFDVLNSCFEANRENLIQMFTLLSLFPYTLAFHNEPNSHRTSVQGMGQFAHNGFLKHMQKLWRLLMLLGLEALWLSWTTPNHYGGWQSTHVYGQRTCISHF